MPSLAPNMMMIRRALNGARGVFSIEKHPKLYLATDGKGGGSWRIKYRPRPDTSQRWLTLTNDARNTPFDEVVRKAGELLSNLSLNGVDPKAHRVTKGKSFDDAFQSWLTSHAKVYKRSWHADELIYERHIKARIGRDLLSAIDRLRVIEVLDDIAAKATPIQANRCQSVISAVFSWALDEGRVKSHPALRIRRRGEERAREYVLSDEQLKHFWAELDDLRDKSGNIIRLLLLTGCRLSEATGMRQAELRLDEGRETWTIPSERTKNKLTHIVPMTPMVVELIKSIDVTERNAFVFPARRVEPQPFDGNHASRTCKEIFRAVGAPEMRLHDLRHQAATGMAQCGVPLEIRQLVLNQISGRRQMIGSLYDQHDYSDEKRRALLLWEARLAAIIEGRALPTDRY